MTRLPPVNLEIPIGVVTERTERGAAGLWNDSNHIRFRQGLPEKLGGWVLSSLGTVNGDTCPADLNGFGPGQVELGAVTSEDPTIVLAGAGVGLELEDNDPIWVFGDQLDTSTLTGNKGDQIVTSAANVTGSRGDGVQIIYPGEVLSTVVTGDTGDTEITVSVGVTSYLEANTSAYIAMADGSVFVTKLAANLMSGATTLTLEDALPSSPHASVPVILFVRDSIFVDYGVPESYVARFLNNSPAASTTLIFTEELPADATALTFQITEFGTTEADGSHSGAGNLSIDPTLDFSAASAQVFNPAWVQTESAFAGFCRALHDWSDLDDQQWLAIGTDVKLYLVSEGALFDITPVRDTGTLTDPFETTASSKVVVVNDVAHGAQVGDYVRYSDADLVGDLDLNGEHVISDVLSVDQYEIEFTVPATTTDTGGGTVDYEYDIQIGRDSTETTTGWGTGAYGAGLYGIGETGVGIEVPLRIWSLDNFGEDLLASPNGSTIYHWDRSGGPTIRAVVVPTAPATIQRMLISPQARHVVAFGAGTGSFDSPGDPDKLFIRWGDQENFADWIPTTTNVAGDIRLDVGSQIITAIESRGDIIVFTDESLHALNYIGGEFVFGLRHLGQSVAIIGPNAAVDVNGVVPFMAEDDFMIYDGVIRVLDCPVRNHVFDDLNVDQGDKVYASVNKKFTEVWWLYPSQASQTNDRYVKWNYKDNVWDFGEIERTAFHDSSRFLGKPYGTQGGKIFQHETGVDAENGEGEAEALASLLASGETEVDAQGSRVMHIGALIPDFKELTGSIDVTLTGRKYPQDGSPVTKGPFTITSSTERQSVRMRSRQVSIKIESSAIGDHWRMGTWRAEARPHGRRGG